MMAEPHKRLARIFAVTGLILGIAGAAYEQIGTRNDLRRLPRIGRAVDIGGRSLNIFCSGEGAPAVIFDSGAGSPGLVWSNIQGEIAKETRACWFDRAGYGWSDIGPFPRTSEAMSADLHELLHRDSIAMPFIYVGHSLGGLNARVYNGMYPAEIAGVVFAAAAHADEPRRAPAFMLGRSAPRPLWHPIWIVAQTARLLGVIRLIGRSSFLPADPAQRTREQILNALRSQPKTIASQADASGPESYREAESAGGFGDRPVIVLTRGRAPQSPPATEMDKQGLAYEQVWMHEIQPKLARLSTRGKQVIVGDSGHDIPDDAPEAVIAAVREVLRDIRHSADRKSTVR